MASNPYSSGVSYVGNFMRLKGDPDACVVGQAAASNILNSKYLRPAQQLLEEVVSLTNTAGYDPVSLLKKHCCIAGASTPNVRTPHQPFTTFPESERIYLKENCNLDARKRRLIALLEEVESQYQKYCNQLNGVITSFELVAGNGSAKPYISLTIQAMSRHFLNLREAIITQLHAPKDSLNLDLNRNHKRTPQTSSIHQHSLKNTGILQNLRMIPLRQGWRPLRGLPESSVAILRTWLFEHFLHPYPDDKEKLMLSSQTGLTRSQISNWFINARVRLWKPMIEEMYREEFPEDDIDISS